MTQITMTIQNTQGVFPNAFAVQVALEVFAGQSLDVSAKGVLRAIFSKDSLSVDELISFMLPRDYDVPVRNAQLDQIRKNLEQVLHGG